MNKKVFLLIAIMVILTIVYNSTDKRAERALEQYNAALKTYNTNLDAYTQEYNHRNQSEIEQTRELKSLIDQARDELNGEVEPLDPTLSDQLREAIKFAESSGIKSPQTFLKYPNRSFKADASKKEQNQWIQETKQLTKKIKDTTFYYSGKSLSSAYYQLFTTLGAYRSSVAKAKQLMVPEQDYVMERLKRVATITAIAAATTEHDPDAQTAKKRNSYLSLFNLSHLLNKGSHEVYGTCVIRTSKRLSDSAQKSLTKQIVKALSAEQ